MAEAIVQINENIDDLNEQLLRIDLKTSQAMNEKVRLEQEYQKYRKLGKQPKVKK